MTLSPVGGEVIWNARPSTMQACKEGMSAEGLLQRLLEEVKAFRGERPQDDDQTIVVVSVED